MLISSPLDAILVYISRWAKAVHSELILLSWKVIVLLLLLGKLIPSYFGVLLAHPERAMISKAQDMKNVLCMVCV
jgi:hypothetical protein